MTELIKTFLESIDHIANYYFILWILSEFYIRSKTRVVDLPCIRRAVRYKITNVLAYIALFIILFLPKALYQ